MENDSIWEVIGKIAVAVTVLTGGIYLYQYFFNDSEPDLVARVDQSSYRYTPNLVSGISEFHDKLDWDVVGDNINDEWLSENEISRSDAETVESAVLRRLRNEWPDDLPGYGYQFKGEIYSVFYRIRLDNRSTYEANDVVLNLPISGIVVIDQNEKTIPVATFSSEIEIDRIRNDSPVTLTIWSKESVNRFDEDDVTLSHTTGVGKVVFGKDTYGTWDALDTYLNISGILLAIWFTVSLVFLIGIIVFFINLISSSFSKNNEEDPETTTPVENVEPSAGDTGGDT